MPAVRLLRHADGVDWQKVRLGNDAPTYVHVRVFRDFHNSHGLVAVKEGVSRSAGRCLHPEEARRLIREGAKRAMSLIGSVKPFVIKPPVRTEVVFVDPSCADNLEYLPFIERIDGRAIAFTTDDFTEAFELFNMMQFYGGSVK